MCDWRGAGLKCFPIADAVYTDAIGYNSVDPVRGRIEEGILGV